MEETLKVLVVDDDVVARMTVRHALMAADLSVEVSEAENCFSAIARLQEQPFDCVFLDYYLPDGNGLALIEQVRASGIILPIVVLTSQGDERIAVELMKAGAADYIAKDRVSPEALCRSMSNAVRIYRAKTDAAIAQAQLQDSEERYRLILEGSNDGIWDWDIPKNEIFWNDRLLDIIGLSAGESGKSGAAFHRTWEIFYSRLHPQDRHKVRDAIVTHLCHNIEFNLEFRLRHRSGEYRHCMARGKAQRDAQGRAIRMAGIISNITLAKQAETDLRRRFEQLQAIYQITEATARAIALDEIYQAALNGLQRALKADRASVLLFDSQGVMRFQAWYELSEAYRRAVEGHSPWLPDASSPQPICIPDVEAAATLAKGESRRAREREQKRSSSSLPLTSEQWQMILNEGIHALAFIPLVYQEKLMGKFMLYYNSAHQFAAEEIQLAQTIASNVAFAIERKRAEEALHRREQEFKALVENAPDIIARFNKQLRLVYVNSALERATGIAPQTIIGKTLAELVIPESLCLLWQASLQQVFATGQEWAIEFESSVPNRTTRHYQARLVPEFARDGAPEFVLSVARDITERKRAEDSQRFLANASTVLSLSLDEQTTLKNLANLAVPQMADWCAIDVVEVEAQGDINPPILHRVALAPAEGSGNELFPSFAEYRTLAIQVVRTGRSELFFFDAAESREEGENLQVPMLRSVICVPLVARGRTLGAIALGLSESERRYTEADLTLAEELGRRVGLAVDNARLYRESQESSDNLRRAILILGEQQQQLRTLQRLTNLLNQRLTNLPELLQVMVQSVCGAIEGAQFCIIVLHNPQCDRLLLTVTAGIGTERLRLEDAFFAGDGWLNQAVAIGECQFIQVSQEREVRSEEQDSLSSPALPASICAVPIESAQGGRLGVLAIGNWESTCAFDEEDQYLLTAVGEQAAIAINNARLIRTLEEREERLAAQNEILATQNQELENQRQQIQLQNVQLMEAARLKSQFLATVSHELRTPMNAIIGFSQLLLRSWQRITECEPQTSLTPNHANMVQRILDNGKHLLTLINDILDLSKIEAGRMELERQEVNIATLVSNTAEELHSLAEEKQLELQLDIRLNNPVVISDSARLRQVLVNLLSNAIKFTEVGVVRVEVWECNPMRIALLVRDTGIGIAQEHLENIFEEFRQVDQNTTKKHYGAGLGLAITLLLVQLMGGTITVESQLGEGSVFQVEIPREIPASGQAHAKPTRRLLR